MRRFRSVNAFSIFLATFSLDKSVRLCERRFSWVVAFSPLRAMFSLHKRIFALARKGNNAFTNKKIWLAKAKKGLWNEKLPRKFENAFTERKRRSQRRKRDYRAKTQTRKRVEKHFRLSELCFRSGNAFSLGKRFFAFARNVLAW